VTTVADPDRLKAMLLAERAESERLRQIIKELQRYRFGRWAETLPEEQLQLGLEVRAADRPSRRLPRRAAGRRGKPSDRRSRLRSAAIFQ
jgi:hypothetical protein